MNVATVLEPDRIRKKTLWFFLGMIVWTGCCCSSAWAQSSTSSTDSQRRAAAEALFDEAKTLARAGRYSEACPKFAASQAMDPAVGTRLNLADCLEKLRQTASAWAEFRAAAAAARAKGQMDRVEIAKKRAANLEREIVRLAVVVPGGSSETIEVRKNGMVLDRGSWGVALPVDPGRYEIVAAIAGKAVYRTNVEIPDKPGTVVTTTLPVLEESVLARRNTQRGFTLAFGTLSIVSLVTGGVLGAGAIWQNSKSEAHCRGNNICDAEGVVFRQDALTLGNAATAAFAIGAATGVAALVLHVTNPPLPPTKIGFGVVQSGAGLIVGGTF